MNRVAKIMRRSLPSDFGGSAVLRVGAGTIKVWLRGDLGVSLGGILLATGTAPPPMWIEGGGGVVGLHIEIDSTAGGTALGQATFKWSINNGTSYVATGVVTAASVVLGSTGITLHCPAGPYNANNKYDATIASWADQSGHANDLSQPTASQQGLCIVSAVNGQPSVRFDGVDDLLAAAFTLIEPCSLFVALDTINADAGARCPWDGGIIQTMWSVFRTAGVSGILDSNATLLTCPNSANGAYHVLGAIYNHASSSVRIDRSPTNGTIGAASAAIGGLTVGALANAGLPLKCEMAEVALYSSVLSAADLATIENYMQARYATP